MEPTGATSPFTRTVVNPEFNNPYFFWLRPVDSVGDVYLLTTNINHSLTGSRAQLLQDVREVIQAWDVFLEEGQQPIRGQEFLANTPAQQ